MGINDWPQEERPREKLLAAGAKALSDAELLAIFISSGTKEQTAVDVARGLLHHFGGIKNILDADQQALCQFKGLGMVKYIKLQAALELNRRYLAKCINGDKNVANSEFAKLYFASHLSQYKQEVFAAAFLDSKHNILHYVELFYGSINRATVYPREVVKKALQYNAAYAIFAHNHISGESMPSEDDRIVTIQLAQALSLVDVAVLDHIIVGKGESFSFAEEKLL